MMRRFGAAALNPLVFLSPAAAAGTSSPGWKPHGLQGSIVRCLGATPDLLCAGTESDGVFCRDLGIANSAWRSLGLQGATISWLWIDPVTPEITLAPGRIDLGEVECVVAGGEIALVDIDPPEPPPGKGLFFLARMAGAADYGSSSGGLPRRPGSGDCAP